MPAHFLEALLVNPPLPPFFKEWIDRDRDIEADQKSPHRPVQTRLDERAARPYRPVRRPLEIYSAAGRARIPSNPEPASVSGPQTWPCFVDVRSKGNCPPTGSEQTAAGQIQKRSKQFGKLLETWGRSFGLRPGSSHSPIPQFVVFLPNIWASEFGFPQKARLTNPNICAEIALTTISRGGGDHADYHRARWFTGSLGDLGGAVGRTSIAVCRCGNFSREPFVEALELREDRPAGHSQKVLAGKRNPPHDLFAVMTIKQARAGAAKNQSTVSPPK
jgi:hypothetical protein